MERNLKKLKNRLSEINNLLKKVDIEKGCPSVDQRISLEIEKKKISRQISSIKVDNK